MTYKTALILTLISLVGCYTKPMEKTLQLQSLPEGVKESILGYSLAGGTYKETLQRIAELRTVTKEWNELLRKQRVVYTSLLHATVDDELEAAELTKAPLARYIAKLATQSDLTPEKKQLLVQLCRPGSSYYELFESLSYIDEAEFTQDEFLVGWPLLFCISTIPEVKKKTVELLDSSGILLKLLSASFMQQNELLQEFVKVFTRAKEYVANENFDRFPLSLLVDKWEVLDGGCQLRNNATLFDRALSEMLGLKTTHVLSVINAEKDYKGLSASHFFKKVQATFDLTHAERTFLTEVFEGNSETIEQNYRAPKNPVLIDIALIIALKAEHDHCIHALIAKELTCPRDFRMMEGMLLVLIQAATRSESVCSTLGNYYADTFKLDENPLVPAMLFRSIVHSSLLEEVQCVNVFLRNLFKNSNLREHIPFDLFIACVNQDEEEITVLVRQLAPGSDDLTCGIFSTSRNALYTALEASMFNQWYKAVMALCTHEFGTNLFEREPFRGLCSADPKLNEIVSTISASRGLDDESNIDPKNVHSVNITKVVSLVALATALIYLIVKYDLHKVPLHKIQSLLGKPLEAK